MKKITQEQLKERNEKFNNLTNGEKAVEIARDVINSIKVKEFIPSTTYGNLDWTMICHYNKVDEDDVQEFMLNELNYKKNPCKVCAMGAVMFSKIKLGNGAKLKDIGESNDIAIQLEGIFSPSQLRLMELAFEGTYNGNYKDKIDADEVYDYGLSGEVYKGEWLNAHKFYRKFGEETEKDREDCIIAIMENIIENNGTFKP